MSRRYQTKIKGKKILQSFNNVLSSSDRQTEENEKTDIHMCDGCETSHCGKEHPTNDICNGLNNTSEKNKDNGTTTKKIFKDAKNNGKRLRRSKRQSSIKRSLSSSSSSLSSSSTLSSSSSSCTSSLSISTSSLLLSTSSPSSFSTSSLSSTSLGLLSSTSSSRSSSSLSSSTTSNDSSDEDIESDDKHYCQCGKSEKSQ